MTVGILAEKPSAARAIAKALGGMSGTYKGEQYVIAAARGHLYGYAEPHEMVNPALADKYKSWDIANLPWNPEDFSWKLKQNPMDGVPATIKQIKTTLQGCSEIVIATDVDPSGEGGMIAGNVITELGFTDKKLSRMYFTDEAAASFQKAFTSRKLIPDLNEFDEFKMAKYRSKFDLLSMQWSRSSSKLSGKTIRQGRLKSAMVYLVGNQLEAIDKYIKKPFYQAQFRDENGVKYVNPDEPMYENKSEVPTNFEKSNVILDSRENKRVAPPKLLDLSALSARLSKEGLAPKKTLAIYQKMYEAQVVSYPRTEDKTITTEQFEELLPLVDKIATLVGANSTLLTRRTPRATHVKDQGAHGANRPGLNVPTNLESLDTTYGSGAAKIYVLLAKSFLSMLAEDYVYEQQKGHVEKYSKFVGTASIPKSLGFKAIFETDDISDTENDDSDENTKGLGRQAEAFVHEGFPPKPTHPNMDWLMKQLDKHDVGTGATRTSTYSDVTTPARGKDKDEVLLVHTARKTTLGSLGKIAYTLLPGTYIGDLETTKIVFDNMKKVAKGQGDTDEYLSVVAKWVMEDLEQMKKNLEKVSDSQKKELGMTDTTPAEYVDCEFEGEKKKFKRVWSGHRFTDEEVEKLKAGELISFQSVSGKTGKEYTATGKLAPGSYNGKPTFGFQLDFSAGSDTPMKKWCGYTFSPDEYAKLEAGETVEFGKVFLSNRTGNKFGGNLTWNKDEKKFDLSFNN